MEKLNTLFLLVVLTLTLALAGLYGCGGKSDEPNLVTITGSTS